jgi:hypothetical protein
MEINLSALAAKISGAVIAPEHEDYEEAISHWAANVDRKAAVVVQVESPTDVAASVVAL